MVIIIAKIRLKNLSDRDAMFAAMKAATPPSLREPGVIAYQSFIHHEDSLVVNGIDVFVSKEAVIAHNRSEHIAVLASEMAGIDADIDVRSYHGAMEPFDLSSLPTAAVWADTAFTPIPNTSGQFRG
jgi:quinol monooxygenase YgiN